VKDKRDALRKAIASTKNFEGINGKWSFDENGDVDYDTMSGFKVAKADTPVGCKFQFETILE
jgi:branched-chain amino acid transport system substrate-binding protein